MPTPDVSPIERLPARLVVLEHLQAWIEDGRLAPGEVIKDFEIAEKLGVSRTPVREALQILEQYGLVEMLPGRRTQVTEAAVEDVARVYAPLAALQALAAELGTPHAGPAEVEEMRKHNAALLAAVSSGDPVAAREADRAFHAVLVRLADNPYLVSAIEPLLMHIRRLEACYFREAEPSRESYDEHERLIDAVAAGDVERARALTHQNFHRYYSGAPASSAERAGDGTDA